MKLLRTIRRLNAIRRKAPHISISQHGQLTANPKVSVSVSSRGGAMSIDTFRDDDAGNAGATLSASSLSNILGLPVADLRCEATNEANTDRTMTSDWHRLPCELTTG